MNKPYKDKNGITRHEEGDLVKANRNGSILRAVVLDYSKPRYVGGGMEYEYSLYIEGIGESAWYTESQVEFIEHDRFDLLKKWKRKKRDRDELSEDLDWIFSEDREPNIHQINGISRITLGSMMINWDVREIRAYSKPEHYHENRLMIFDILVDKYIKNHDKEGFIKYCSSEEKYKDIERLAVKIGLFMENNKDEWEKEAKRKYDDFFARVEKKTGRKGPYLLHELKGM